MSTQGRSKPGATPPWHAMSPDEVLQDLDSHPAGLNAETAAQRLAATRKIIAPIAWFETASEPEE